MATSPDAGEPLYLALIGDIVGSRALEDRAAVQRALRGLLEELNGELEGQGLAAPLTLTAGDEVQALLAAGEPVVDVVVRLADHLHPVSMVWGVGRGRLDTDLGPDVSALDGPCFHGARDAVAEAARRGVWLRAEGLEPLDEQLLAALFRLMGGIRSRWTEVQARYVREVRGRLQRDVARRLGVSEPAVSKALAAAQFAAVEEGEEAARTLLRRSMEGAADSPAGAP